VVVASGVVVAEQALKKIAPKNISISKETLLTFSIAHPLPFLALSATCFDRQIIEKTVLV
jgi:hypothetical protein